MKKHRLNINNVMISLTWLIRLLLSRPGYFKHLCLKKYRFKKRYKWVRKKSNGDDKAPPPLVYKIILTEKCNLRCKMCWYWGEKGVKTNLPGENDYFEYDLFNKIVSQIKSTNPSFILTGGEPMMHPRFLDIIELLKKEKLFTTVCTNGMLIDQFEGIWDSNPYLDLLISLDGLERENDKLRGEGVYSKVINSIDIIKKQKAPVHIGIQCTITPENVSMLYDFCKQMVKLDVDWILLNTGWFITGEEKNDYEKYILQHYKINPKSHLGYCKPYLLDPNIFQKQYKKIIEEKWPIKISTYFKNPCYDIMDYLNNPNRFIDGAICFKQWLRMDILPDGKVVACGTYPDVALGDLKKENIIDVWNSSKYIDFRKVLTQKMLPVCSKCNALYLYNDKG